MYCALTVYVFLWLSQHLPTGLNSGYRWFLKPRIAFYNIENLMYCALTVYVFLWLSQHLPTGRNSDYRWCVWGKTWSYILCILYELNKLYNSCIGFPLSSAHVLCGSYNCISDWSRPIESKRFCFVLTDAARPEIFIGWGGEGLTLKLCIIYI